MKEQYKDVRSGYGLSFSDLSNIFETGVVIPPDSTVKLYGGLPITNSRTFIFKDYKTKVQIMDDYIIKKITPTKTVTGNTILVNLDGVDINKLQYISFLNPAFEGREIYGKIVHYAQVASQKAYYITFTVDYWLSFMDLFNFGKCFIERSHLSVEDYNYSKNHALTDKIPALMTQEPLPLEENFFEAPDQTNARVLPTQTKDNKTYKGGNYCENAYVMMTLASFDPSRIEGSRYFFYSFTDFMGDFKDYGTDFSITGTPANFKYPNPVFIGFDFYGYYPVGDYNSNYAPFLDIEVDTNGKSKIILPDGSGVRVVDNARRALASKLDWLTTNNLIGNIVDICIVPGYIRDALLGKKVDTSYTIKHKQPKVNNYKLYRAPFSMIEASKPDGSAKIYKWEDTPHTEILTAGSGPDGLPASISKNFITSVHYDGIPQVILTPGQSKGKMGWVADDDRMVFSVRNQIAYTTDNYLTYLAGQTQQINLNNTDYNVDRFYRNYARDQMNNVAGIVRGGTQLVGSGMNYLGGGGSGVSLFDGLFSGVMNIANSGMNIVDTEAEKLQQEALARDVERVGKETISRDQLRNNHAISEGFSGSESAIVDTEYHPGSEDVSHDLIKNRIKYKLHAKYLKPEILKRYDDYLSSYGLNFSYEDTPNIQYFMKNNNAKSPQFLRSDGFDVCYIKTKNAQVSGTIPDACDYVANMLNNGVQFINAATIIRM